MSDTGVVTPAKLDHLCESAGDFCLRFHQLHICYHSTKICNNPNHTRGLIVSMTHTHTHSHTHTHTHLCLQGSLFCVSPESPMPHTRVLQTCLPFLYPASTSHHPTRQPAKAKLNDVMPYPFFSLSVLTLQVEK